MVTEEQINQFGDPDFAGGAPRQICATGSASPARPPGNFRFPIVVYHSIDDYGTSLSVNPSVFTKQIEWLANRGYQTVSLQDIAERVATHQPIPKRTLALTFDDAMPSVLAVAAPILREYGMFGTTFVVTGQVGQKPEWYRLAPKYQEQRLLDRQELESLRGLGWEIQPHTHDHPVLTHLPLQVQLDQITRSRDCIRAWFGTAAGVLAYPFGQFNADTLTAMQQAEMAIGLSLQFSTKVSSSAMFEWPRIGSAWFKDSKIRQHLALAGFLETYVKIRNRIKGDRTRHFGNPTSETTRGLGPESSSPHS